MEELPVSAVMENVWDPDELGMSYPTYSWSPGPNEFVNPVTPAVTLLLDPVTLLQVAPLAMRKALAE